MSSYLKENGNTSVKDQNNRSAWRLFPGGLLLILGIIILSAWTQPAQEAPVPGALDGFQVTIIGSGNPKLDLARGGPSTLVRYKGASFLVDCGPGATIGLMKAGIEPRLIKNLLFTHLHYDHNADYWAFSIGGWTEGRSELNLVGPVGVKDLHKLTLDFFKKDLDYRINVVKNNPIGIRDNVNIRELTRDTGVFEMEGVRITTLAVPHTIETYAYRFEAGGQSVVISGDMLYSDKFAPFAKGADILVIDGQMSINFTDLSPARAAVMRKTLTNSHLTNEDIARIAAAASPGKLVLSHLSGTMDLQANIKLYGAAGFHGETIEAADGLTILP
jgi:ribonuclease BN (tRNA processing enzyme)